MDIERHLDEYEEWADKFQQLPLYFMGFYGSADINTVVKVATLVTVYVYHLSSLEKIIFCRYVWLIFKT